MSVKTQCFFCSDTISSGSLNRNYYKMHLENVHSIQHNSEQLLNWTLSQQNLSTRSSKDSGGAGSTLSSVASILGMKGITITKDTSSPSNGVPNSLINIKGITVQKVSDDIQVLGSPVTGAPRGRGGASTPLRGGQSRPPQQHAAIARQQDQAIERWSNACEHGCRLCKRDGKNFTTFHRNTLIKHLESAHKIGERDYKEEFKCQNLITRASNMTCVECKHKVKRIPSSLSAHVKKHGMTIRQYWMKHVAPKGSALATFNPNGAFRGQPMRGGRGGWARGGPIARGGRGGMMPQFRGGMRPPVRPKMMMNDTPKINGNYQPKVMLNRVDNETIAREEAGLGGDDAMEVELDPLTLLEMGMGEDVIQIEGVAVKEEVDSAGENDESSVQITPDASQDHETEDNKESRDLVTPDMADEETTKLNEESSQDEEESKSETRTEKENEGVEIIRDVSVLPRDPKQAIPLPDLSTPTKPTSQDAANQPDGDQTTLENGQSDHTDVSQENTSEEKCDSSKTVAESSTDANADKSVSNKHSIGSILSQNKEESLNNGGDDSQSTKQFPAAEHYTPPSSTPNTPYPPQNFPPPYSQPNQHFQPYPNQSQPYNNFPQQQFPNNYPPTTNQGYMGPPHSFPNHHPNFPPPPQGNQPANYHPPPQNNYNPSYGQGGFNPPKTRWDTLSCPYSIAQCPLYCCHVRGMQELEEGSTDWSRPYGPPASGFGDPCACCINT